MPLLIENLLLVLLAFAVGLGIGWLVWGRRHDEV